MIKSSQAKALYDGKVSGWTRQPIVLPLNTESVHIWRVRLDQVYYENFLDMMSTDECQRANRFHFACDRQRFITTRGALRSILGNYLSLAPDQICFHVGAHGKPLLRNEPDVCFNISHSQGLMLAAFSLRHIIGIDVEYIRPLHNIDMIARRFALLEQEALESLNGREKQRAFFACWSRKEAFIKATGEGLSRPLQSFAVALDSDTPVALSIYDRSTIAEQWQLYPLKPACDYAAAVCYYGDSCELVTGEWNI